MGLCFFAGDQNLGHISAQSGATVVLGGRGSNPVATPWSEHTPLHISITSNHAESVVRARDLAMDLICHVHNELGTSFPGGWWARPCVVGGRTWQGVTSGSGSILVRARCQPVMG